MPLSAHLWTIAPNVLQRVTKRPGPAGEPWSTVLDDPEVGPVTLRGVLRRQPACNACLVVVHGLGGHPLAHYCVSAARAADRLGISCLRIGLRGADREGDDFYHAGLVADLDAVIASPALAGFERLYVLGYSLGGQLTLRYALSPSDSRVRAVAAVCAPLDLELGAQSLDRPQSFVYRRHVLAGLREIYTAVARRRPVPTPLSRLSAVRTIREWDSLTVVPRFGLGTVEDYYASMSVGPHLGDLQRPSLLVQSELDPMVPPWTYEGHLARAHPNLEAHRLHLGGHVAFPRVPFGEAPSAPLARHVIEWLMRR